MENRRLTRSNDRMIAGVCSGIAEYVDCHAGIQKKMILQMRFELYWEEEK